MWFLSFREVALVGSIAELNVAIILWLKHFSMYKAYACLWLASIFTVYHIGLVVMHYHGMCPCLGTAFEWLPGGQALARSVTCGMIVLLYLLGSLLLVAERWKIAWLLDF